MQLKLDPAIPKLIDADFGDEGPPPQQNNNTNTGPVEGDDSDSESDSTDDESPPQQPVSSLEQLWNEKPKKHWGTDNDDSDNEADVELDGDYNMRRRLRKLRDDAKFEKWLQRKTKEIRVEDAKKTVDRDALSEEEMSAKSMISSTNIIINDPREYQLELFEASKKQNTIAVLDTGSGKTLIACLLLRHTVERELEDRQAGKRWRVSCFLVDCVTLVFQQAAVLECNLDAKVGKYYGAMGVDFWEAGEWRKILSSKHILVMTADVLYNCLVHAMIKMTDINLICFDEAHHAKKKHVYARIVKDFYDCEPEENRPRIFGMTASPVDSRANVIRSAEELETLLHSRISTASDLALLKYSVSRPLEKILSYERLPPPSHSDLYKRLYSAYKDINCFGRIFEFARVASSELGTWCADEVWSFALTEQESVKLQARKDRLMSRMTDQNGLKKVEMEIQKIREAREIVEKHQFTEPTQDSPCISSKVWWLNRFLHSIYDKQTDDKCIIFVTRRYTAHTLKLLFEKIGPPFLRLDILIGTKSGATGEENVTFRQQMIIVSKFRKGKLNCLIATSVAEEGLDIPDCSQIVRFDLYSTMIQYIQSRGRARHAVSKYVHMVESDNPWHRELVREVQGAETTMREFCQSLPEDRKLKIPVYDKIDDETSKELANQEPHVEPSTGAKLTPSSAMQLIAHFSSKLDGNETPSYNPRVTSRGRYTCELILPSSSPIISIMGTECKTRTAAKISAAFKACLELRKLGFLDEYLLPISSKKNIPDGANRVTSADDQKTNKHLMRAKPTFWDVSDPTLPLNLYVTVFGIVDPRAMDRPHSPLCVLTRREFPNFPNYKVYADGGGESEVYSINLDTTLDISGDFLGRLTTFLDIFFYDVFNKKFDLLDSSKIPYWVLPAKDIVVEKHNHPKEIIDWDMVNLAIEKREYKWDPAIPAEFYEGKILVDSLNRSRRYLVRKVEPAYKPNDLIPLGSSISPYAVTILDYTYSRGRKGPPPNAPDGPQPVLLAYRVLQRIKYLEPPTARDVETVNMAYICPSAFDTSTLSSAFFFTGIVFPSISHRIDSYLHALDACKIIGANISLGLALEAITKSPEESNKRSDQEDEVDLYRPNYERLEFLGDTFLKTTATLSLFVKYKEDNEYHLHVKRMKMVCNQNLYENAIKLGIPKSMQSEPFSRRLWYPRLTLLKGKGAKSPNPNVERYHSLSNKSIADVCEALIGAALRDKGFDEAVKVVNTVVNSEDHDPALIHEFDSYFGLYKKPDCYNKPPTASQLELARQIEEKIGYKFKCPRLLLSAFVHPSVPFSQEGVQNYQRLEFLGDALHDQTCIQYIFNAHPTKGPQWLTEHKMAMVANKFLAALAVELEFHRHLRKNGSALLNQIMEFVEDVQEAKAAAKGRMDYWNNIKTTVPKALSDCLEAFIGAMFVDSDFTFSVVQSFFDKFIKRYFVDMTIYDTYAGSHATTLLTSKLAELGCEDWGFKHQEVKPEEDAPRQIVGGNIVQAQPYVLVAFFVHSEIFGDGKAPSRKVAKVKASQKALDKIEYYGRGFFTICNCAEVREKTRKDKEEKEKAAREMEKEERMKEKKGNEDGRAYTNGSEATTTVDGSTTIDLLMPDIWVKNMEESYPVNLEFDYP